MTNQSDDETKQIASGLRKVLNMHGHGFHYAVLRRVDQLYLNGQTSWVFDGAEFPVVAGHETTHIDIILRSRSYRTYLIGECKRVDPARGNWCFAKAPYTWRNPSEEVIFDQFICGPSNSIIQKPCIHRTQYGIYNLGLELKIGKSGDGTSHGGSAINQAVAQVLRCSSGLINHLLINTHRSYQNEKIVRFIPAIFTTAQLWVTEADLGAAELATGDLPSEAVEAKKSDWILYNHNRSPILRHDLEWNGVETELSKELKVEFARSIAIVSTDGIDKFLGMDMDEWLE